MVESRVRPVFGIVSFVAGLVALGSVAMIAATSLLPGFNPPDWIRIATMVPLPFALLASVGFGAVGFARRAGRGRAIAGMSVSAVAVVGFVLLLSTMG